MTEPQKPHRMTHRNAVTGEIISVTEYPENAPILPALTANERGADRGRPDAEIKEIARRLRLFADCADAAGHLISAKQDRATASMLDAWIAERAQHAEISKAFEDAAVARDEAGFLGSPADCIRYLKDEIAAAVQADAEEFAALQSHLAQHCAASRPQEGGLAAWALAAIRARGTTSALDRTEAGVRDGLTPETPLMVEANTVSEMREAGYEAVFVDDCPPDYDPMDGGDGVSEIAVWEPRRPEGEGWKLHIKGWVGDEGDIGAVWYRPALPTPASSEGKQ